MKRTNKYPNFNYSERTVTVKELNDMVRNTVRLTLGTAPAESKRRLEPIPEVDETPEKQPRIK